MELDCIVMIINMINTIHQRDLIFNTCVQSCVIHKLPIQSLAKHGKAISIRHEWCQFYGLLKRQLLH